MLGLFILNFLSDKYKNFLMKIKMAGSFFSPLSLHGVD